MKYRITKKGEKLWPNFSYVWDKSHLKEKGVSITTALELCLFEEVPERIELRLGRTGGGVYSKGEPLTESDHKTFEHCINGEWGLIMENLRWIQGELHLEYIESRHMGFLGFITDKIKALKNS